MQGNEWVYVAIAVLLSAHLLMLLYAYRANRSDSGFDADIGVDDTGGASERDDSAICRCPECGTENDSTYRFCRECVAELPATQLHIEHPGRQQQPY